MFFKDISILDDVLQIDILNRWCVMSQVRSFYFFLRLVNSGNIRPVPKKCPDDIFSPECITSYLLSHYLIILPVFINSPCPSLFCINLAPSGLINKTSIGPPTIFGLS